VPFKDSKHKASCNIYCLPCLKQALLKQVALSNKGCFYKERNATSLAGVAPLPAYAALLALSKQRFTNQGQKLKQGKERHRFSTGLH
jgi:hypothetical protein